MISTKKLLSILLIPIILAACLPGFEKSTSNSDVGYSIESQTYSNEKYSFTVNLPSDWQLIEMPTSEFPDVMDQVWFVNKSLPMPDTDARADIILIFTQKDPSSIWEKQYFDDYEVKTLWLGDIQAKKISGINKESKFPEIVVLAKFGDYYLQALPNQSENSLEYFDPIITTIRYENSNTSDLYPNNEYNRADLENQFISFDGISFEYPSGLFGNAYGQKLQAYVDPSGFLYDDIPEHVRFEFSNPYTLNQPFRNLQTSGAPWLQHQNPADIQGVPQIFVFSTKEYTEINVLVAERIRNLSNIIAENNSQIQGELPVLPTFNSAQDFQSKVIPINFQSGRGVRFLTRYSQGVSPITNSSIFYTFQGLTDDESRYVAAFFPLYTSVLPDHIQIENWDTFNKIYNEYLNEIEAQLNNLDLDDFEPELEILDHIIQSIAISDNQQLATSPSDTQNNNLSEPSEPICFETNLFPISFMPDNERILFKVENGVQIFNLKTLTKEQSLDTQKTISMPSIALSPDGKYLAWALDDFSIQIVEISENKILKTIIGHQDIVGKLVFSPDGDRLYSISHDTWVKEWDINGNLIKAFQPAGALGIPNEVLGIGISPDGSMLATIHFDGPVKLWRTSDFELIRVLGATGGYDTTDISFSPNGKLVVADTATGLFLWETSTGRALIQGNPGINSMASIFSPDGRFLAYGEIGENNKVVISTPDGAKKIHILDAQIGATGILFFSPDGSLLLASDWVETRIWRVVDGQLLYIGKGNCP